MFLIGWYEIVNTNSSLNFVNVDAKMPENNLKKTNVLQSKYNREKDKSLSYYLVRVWLAQL